MPAEPSESRLKVLSRRSSRREEDFKAEAGHSRELELKRSRGEVSCAECRRLKIKCSREIPCENCCKRGCSQLCPNGRASSILPGLPPDRACDRQLSYRSRNTVCNIVCFVLAATEHLHRKIARYGERIRQLEDALTTLQAKHSSEPHPLLQSTSGPQISGAPDQAEEDAGYPSNTPLSVVDALGTLTINEDGVSHFFGPTGGSESLLVQDLPHEPLSPPSSGSSPPSSNRGTQSPSSLPLFSNSFPLTPFGQPSEIRSVVEANLPTYDRAVELCTVFVEQVGWVFRAVKREQLFDELLPLIYSRARQDHLAEEDNEHELAMIYTVFALAASVEPSKDPDSQLTLVEHYQQLARAALNLRPILEKPTLLTIQALHLLSVLNGMGHLNQSITGAETASLLTLSCHLSQTIGLHRDAARWGLPHKEVQRRRFMFYGLWVADLWLSLSTGRPPSFSPIYSDCPLPEFDNLAPEDVPEAQAELWLYRFSAEVVSEVASKTLTPAPPSHQTVLELDKKVRGFPTLEKMEPRLVPNSRHNANAPSISHEIINSFQSCAMEHMREIILLYVHRSYFAQAVIDSPTNPLKSRYSTSFLAAYRAASTILKSLNQQFSMFPVTVSRLPMMLTYAFSAAVVFGTVVTRGPTSPLASSAIAELETACVMFSKAAPYSNRGKKALHILLNLREKGRLAVRNAKLQKSIDAPVQTASSNEDDDELSIFAGRTRFRSHARPTPRTSPAAGEIGELLSGSSKHGEHIPIPVQSQEAYARSQDDTNYSRMDSDIRTQPIVGSQATPQPPSAYSTQPLDPYTQSIQGYQVPPAPYDQAHPTINSAHYTPLSRYDDHGHPGYHPSAPPVSQPGYYDESHYATGAEWAQQPGMGQRWGNFMQNSGVFDNVYRPY